MSTTTSGFRSVVVRLISSRGWFHSGDPFAGVTQPPTQVDAAAPAVGGGDAGIAGGVGGAVVGGGVASGLGIEPELFPPVQAPRSPTRTASSEIRTMNLGKGRLRTGCGALGGYRPVPSNGSARPNTAKTRPRHGRNLHRDDARPPSGARRTSRSEASPAPQPTPVPRTLGDGRGRRGALRVHRRQEDPEGDRQRLGRRHPVADQAG